jgi:phospholipid/cholesterol/gamma-HCH transport system substrate-binding protein
VSRVGQLTTRRQNVLTGAIALLLLLSTTTVGIKAAFGAFETGYELVGRFDAAGQGLLPDSDVKIRGVNVGQVKGIELVDGKAEVRLRIHDDERVPRAAIARIRAKTLFGEKFVDLDLTEADEAEGPFYEDGDELERTEGGFELEQVLSDAFPLLQEIDGQELMTVVSNLAEGGRGLGEAINRTIVNGATVSEVFADNAELTAEFLEDLAALSGQLADSADDLLGIADSGNAALPVLNEGEQELITILQQAGRLSNDVADLLLGNQPFVDAALGGGSVALQALYDQRTQVVPLVIGLRQYLQTLTEVVRIPLDDGTLMGAVKAILGSEVCFLLPCPGGSGNPQAGVAAGGPALPSGPPAPLLGQPEGPSSSDGDLGDLLRRVLGT